MKTILLFCTFACLISLSFGQYSRSVYSEGTPERRHHSLYSFNGETTIVSIRNSSNDTLRVTFIDIDENGETSNYRFFEHSPFDMSEAFALSGIGVNATGDVSLCILKHNVSGAMDAKYITVNPTSGTFGNHTTIANQFKKGFTRTRVKNDSLITYFANYASSGMSRVARSLSSPNISIEIAVGVTASYSGTLFQNGVKCEVIFNNSDEYVSANQVIFKRNSFNSYIEVAANGVFDAQDLAMTANGDLLAIDSYGAYTLYDGNLAEIGSGNIPELQVSLNAFTELYALPNGGFRMWKSDNSSTIIVDLSSSYTLDNVQQTPNRTHDQFVFDGKQYVVGSNTTRTSEVDISGIPFPNQKSSITIVYDGLTSTVPKFIDYDQLLSTENIQFHTNHVSRSFNNSEQLSAGFEFEQNGLSRSLIFTSVSTFAGTGINGSLLGNSGNYVPTQTTGPYSPILYNHEVMDKYNRGYYVTRDMIESHLFEISTGNPAYVIPFGIREWPAHGDVLLGQAANLADFIDQNGNGMYEPELGDYPKIYGDQCLLNMYHQHPATPNSASIETHQYYFTFDCDTSEVVENTVFIRTHNFSRGQVLSDVYEGDYVDFDLGNFSDDYIGTNVALGMIYAYNGDFYDETNAGNYGFQDTIPAIGMMTLQGLKLDDDGIDNFTTVGSTPESNGIGFNDGTIDNEYYTMESSYGLSAASGPTSSLLNWKFMMQGLNPDGSPNLVNGVQVRHDYLGSSDPLFYSSNGIDHGNNHSEPGSSNPAGDRRILGASGPSTFTTTDTMVLIKAYLVASDVATPSPLNSLDRLFEHGQAVRDYFDQNSLPCGGTFDSYTSSSVLSVEEPEFEPVLAFPNPAFNHVQLKGINGSAHVTIIDLNGRQVLAATDISNYEIIDISALEKAVYMVHVKDENGSRVIRLVKQ